VGDFRNRPPAPISEIRRRPQFPVGGTMNRKMLDSKLMSGHIHKARSCKESRDGSKKDKKGKKGKKSEIPDILPFLPFLSFCFSYHAHKSSRL
jgi:hypothetical protein